MGDTVNSPSFLEYAEKKLSSSVLATIDHNMEMISNEMKWSEYRRDKVEVHLCESMANRYLNKKDLFFRGQKIFNLIDGKPMVKDFDSVLPWRELNFDHVVREKNKYVQRLANKLLEDQTSC